MPRSTPIRSDAAETAQNQASAPYNQIKSSNQKLNQSHGRTYLHEGQGVRGGVVLGDLESGCVVDTQDGVDSDGAATRQGYV
jgi:hypothetical protein